MKWTGVRGQILTEVSMKRYTSMRVGGKARYLVYPEDQTDLTNAVRMAKEHGIAYRFLGNGTNVIVSDQGFDGVVIRTRKMAGLRFSRTTHGVRARVGGGGSLKGLIKECAKRGLSGIEKLFGIPGTVGGAVKMNAGSFGSVISDHLMEITTVDESGVSRTVGRGDLSLGYRTSGLSASDCVTWAEFLLKEKDLESIKGDMAYVWGERINKHPMEWPSAGSVFKNKNGQPAWQTIDAAGLRGFRFGDACLSPKHPNFIVNLGHASALDVKRLIEKVKKEVYEKLGTVMEEEVELWGFNG
ncbi:MAG TPA: UDP-N-acetylenolpyruvoylglucosamine reductase [Deltaproteobacteria bacterium]|nr:UDP-N-acetylenolpyruvoylglucosamine reductase [Deltaproteobacteria bacterium]